MELSTVLAVVLPAVLAGLALLVRVLLKASKYEATVRAVAAVVYPVFKRFADATPNKVDDQVAEFLRLLNDGLAADGHPPVDEAKAKALLAELHG